MNTLHISSTNTVGEVIEALLKKFLVTESPAKFALYKRCHREDQGTRLRFLVGTVSASAQALFPGVAGRPVGVAMSVMSERGDSPVTSEPRDGFPKAW